MIIGIDPGERRYGVAYADSETRIARPGEVIDATETDPVDRIAALVDEHDATCVVVGRPVGLAGHEGPAVQKLQGFLQRLRERLEVEVDVYDERMTTIIAERGMRDSGMKAAKRKQIRDAVAAQVMLQGYIDAHSK